MMTVVEVFGSIGFTIYGFYHIYRSMPYLDISDFFPFMIAACLLAMLVGNTIASERRDKVERERLEIERLRLELERSKHNEE
jgi:hypothetical protein